MSLTSPKDLTARIDELGNSIALLFSDSTSLRYIREIFSGTIVGTVADVLAKRSDSNIDSLATDIKTCIVNDCLRAVSFAIYADDVVEASELDLAYPILKPLAAFYQRYVGGRYSPFGNLERSGVFDFLHTHMNDPDFFGGNNIQTKTYYEGKVLSQQELLTLQCEHIGFCLSWAADPFTDRTNDDRSIMNITNYLLCYIVSDGKGSSADDLMDSKDTEIKRLIKFNEACLTAGKIIMSKIDQSLVGEDKLAKSKYISNWYNQNKQAKSNISHFADSWFVGTDFIPAPLPGNQASIFNARLETPDDALKEAMEELESLEGLSSVKKEVSNLVAFLKIQKQRREHGMKGSSQALHYVFHGNPGTGKTTVARILAKIFFGFGILKTPNFTETDRSGLVAGFVGQTAVKTDEVIQKSLDGVLFIDEAYTLSKGEGGEDYGQEAVDTLLKRMEDHRDRLIVIVAGYPEQMRQFVLSNPGLQSRFTRSIVFEDYSVAEMCRIYERMCQKEEYTLSFDALAYASVLFTLAHRQKDEHFGNGRFVRNVYENTTMNQSTRLAALPQVTKKALATLEHADIPLEMIPNVDRSVFDFSQMRWLGTCPGCQKSINAKPDFIGQRVTCKQCNVKFVFPWWNPVPETIIGVNECR